MGRVRINFNKAGLGNTIFNNILNAFKKEHGYHANAYDGYYNKKPYWKSELSEWLSVKGFPCLMCMEMTDIQSGPSTTAYDLIGVEMDSVTATAFIITWS
jgi:hypothetical protein